MNKVISLNATTALVDAVVDTVFIEKDGRIDYFPEYLDVAKAYYKVFFFAPEMVIEGETIFDFYVKYINGEYNEALNNYVDVRQSKYIDKAIDKKIAFRQNQIINPFACSLTRLLNNVSSVVEKYSKYFEGVDVNKLIDGISAMGEKFDTEKAIELLIDKKNSIQTKTENTKGE